MKNILITTIVSILILSAYYFGKRYFLKPDIKQGVEASEITGILPDGSPFMLSSLQGKYVLLDFWGSWCKPCRESNPQLVELYRDFSSAEFSNAQGFEVVSFGVERTASGWKEAISFDGLFWPYHLVSTDLFDSPVVRAYKVKQIPTKFLLNPDGIIIAVDPSLERTRELLTQQLKHANAK
jgi:thiol-disulfide isomerase/thioredoxin